MSMALSQRTLADYQTAVVQPSPELPLSAPNVFTLEEHRSMINSLRGDLGKTKTASRRPSRRKLVKLSVATSLLNLSLGRVRRLVVQGHLVGEKIPGIREHFVEERSLKAYQIRIIRLNTREDSLRRRNEKKHEKIDEEMIKSKKLIASTAKARTHR